MSKNLALDLPRTGGFAVRKTVVPKWECKSAALILNTQEADKNILKLFFTFFINP